MELTKRQEQIVEIVKQEGPITGRQIAEKLSLIRATLRPDLTLLTMAGILEARPRVGYIFTGKTINSLVAQRINKIKVKDVCSFPFVLDEQVSIYDAIVSMFMEDVGTLFITKNGYLEGVVSRKDLLKATMGGMDVSKVPVMVVMTKMPNVVTINPDDPILLAAQKLVSREIDALPVVEVKTLANGEEKLRVTGRITKTTITKLFVELGETR
ncbi:putative signal transduction protein [Thermincola ferriacetica]|uniref:Putative signal transduction protein n=1 Tax=Thermincola ferriacetica TaxID=281456 RepID=A0A0L6VY34_9FIRM|nr:helix-turn-helix transcriptional regulator [Thermincola ferriacetica]KNZ68242.1 putative signal transduction protein [Thermincola ferriacetica]